MSKKKKESENKTEESGTPKKKSSLKIILVVILILLLLAAAGAGGVFFLLTQKAGIVKSTLPPEILSFLQKQLPELYSSFAILDEEIVLTDNEMIRIAKIGDTFPEQKKIADTEYKIWESNMKALQKGQADFEKEIQVFYVSYQVNPETGKTLMDEKRDALKQNLESLVTSSKPLTDKLRELEAKKPFLQRTIDKLFKGKP
jgi:flagellar basal body-associated protein FliL